jgi:hypothetical protein
MANSPDGRTSSDNSCFECLAPDGISRGTGWGVWIQGYGPNSNNRWMWQPVSPPLPPPNSYNRTTPAISPSVSADTPNGASANPVQFSSPGVGPVAPGSNQPLTTLGATGSSGNPTIDSNRKVVGQLPNGPAFSNPS